MSELPRFWIQKKLEEVCLITMGQSPPSSTYNTNKIGLPFFQGKADFGAIHPTLRTYCSAPRKVAEKGDILLSVRAPVGPTNLCFEKSCIGRGLASIRYTLDDNSKYIFYFLRSIEKELSNSGTGSTFTAISKADIHNIEIPIAPLQEQKRIVEKLDKLLVKVEESKARLEKIPGILKRFRQSVLNAAVTGELTKIWCEKNLINNAWSEIELAKVCTSITDGDHQPPPQTKDGIPFLVISNIISGKLNFDSVTRFVSKSYFSNLKSPRIPKAGDLLYTVTGSIGIPVYVAINKEFCFQRHIAIIKPDNNIILSRYLYYFLLSEKALQQGISVATGIAQLTIPLKGLRQYRLPLPPISEQKEIIRILDSLFQTADEIEERYKKAKCHIEKITQSILAKAFSGELVQPY